MFSFAEFNSHNKVYDNYADRYGLVAESHDMNLNLVRGWDIRINTNVLNVNHLSTILSFFFSMIIIQIKIMV